MAAVGARIADQLVPLVERLRGVERLLRAEAEQPVGVALQLGQIVEQRRRHALRLALRWTRWPPVRCAPAPRSASASSPSAGSRIACCSDSLSRARGGAVPQPRALVGLVGRRALRVEGGDHFEVVLGHEAADGQFALHQHRERGRLHAAHGEVLAVGQRVGAREIHADQPVGAAASARGVGQRIVIRCRAAARRTPADGVGRERRDPQAADRLAAAAAS